MKKLPYLPESREILYVSAENKFMQAAKKVAETKSLDAGFKTGAVIVKDGEIIGEGANGSNFHQKFGCIRKFLKIKTGKKYWLCPGCLPHNHAEQSALADVKFRGISPQGADLYLWGHWWCCQSCWAKMIEAEIENVYLEKK